MLIITGPGRCGTSALIKFFREMGYKVTKTDRNWVKKVNGGLDHKEANDLNRSIENSEITKEEALKEIEQLNNYSVLKANTLFNFFDSTLPIWKRGIDDLNIALLYRDPLNQLDAVYRHADHFGIDEETYQMKKKELEDIKETEEYGKKYKDFMKKCAELKIPCRIIEFPDYISEFEDTYKLLGELGMSLDFEEARKKWNNVMDTKMVHIISPPVSSNMQKSKMQKLFVYHVPEYQLQLHESNSADHGSVLLSHKTSISYPVNDIAALVWACCGTEHRVSEIVLMLTEAFAEVPSLKQDVLEILGQFHDAGVIKFSKQDLGSDCVQEELVNKGSEIILESRTDVLNYLIRRDSRYLEIGLAEGKNHNNIKCDNKVSVDPDRAANATFKMTSDEFFEQNTEIYDVVFIDGLHFHEQVYRDIMNSLDCLADGGTIVCHDMNPSKKFHQERTPPWKRPELKGKVKGKEWEWTGDCWKAWARLRSERSDLDMTVIDIDWGCGIVRRGFQDTISIPDVLDWSYFVANKIQILDLVNSDDFVNKDNGGAE